MQASARSLFVFALMTVPAITTAQPVGCENSSRRYGVLVDDTAEPITAQNTSITKCPRRCH